MGICLSTTRISTLISLNVTTYYPDEVPTLHNPVSRYNVDELNNDPKLKLFKCPGGKAGKGQKHRLEKEEKDCIMLYVLMNMEEVVGFIR